MPRSVIVYLCLVHICIFTVSMSPMLYNGTSSETLVIDSDTNCISPDKTGCKCEMTDGSGTIDLTSVGYTDNQPRFKDYPAPDGAKYSYNPCYGFTEGKCINSAVCMFHGKSMLSIGQADDVMFQYQQDLKSVVTAYFTHQTIVLSAQVELICDTTACDPVFDPIGVQEMGLYLFKLTSVCACPGMCTSSGTKNCKTSSGIWQVGTIICIGFAVIVILYLVCGIIYNKIRHEASGTNLIPHKEFWTRIFGYIKVSSIKNPGNLYSCLFLDVRVLNSSHCKG
ncbi:hypothetical protein ACF0H5_019399 [Mactra antiquata]